MSDDDQKPIADPEEGDGAVRRQPEDADEQPGRPHRVIGTPSQVAGYNLLGESEHGGASGRTLLDPAAGEGGQTGQTGQAVQPGYRVLPGDAEREKRAEKFVGFFFLLSG